MSAKAHLRLAVMFLVCFAVWSWITIDAVANSFHPLSFSIGCAMLLYVGIAVHHHLWEYWRKS